jgi:hypothetical protein
VKDEVKVEEPTVADAAAAAKEKEEQEKLQAAKEQKETEEKEAKELEDAYQAAKAKSAAADTDAGTVSCFVLFLSCLFSFEASHKYAFTLSFSK